MLTQLTPADAEPVDIDEAKAHLRVTHNADDLLITSLIRAARETVEANTGRALVGASYLWTVDEWRRPARLPLLPASSVESVSYLDSYGARIVMDPSDYHFDVSRSQLDAPCWGRSVNVEFTTDPGDVPASLKAAILLLVGDMYENAEANVVGSAVSENPTFQRLVFPWRVNLGV